MNTGAILAREKTLKEVISEFCEPRIKTLDDELGRRQII